MASELRVNTLKDAAGANSVAMEYVAGGSAKAWVSYKGTATNAVKDSLNISSVTDASTGRYLPQFSNSFGAVDYLSQTTGNNADGPVAANDFDQMTTSSGDMRYKNSSFSTADTKYAVQSFNGDLA
jgi:hypothetical protein